MVSGQGVLVALAFAVIAALLARAEIREGKRVGEIGQGDGGAGRRKAGSGDKSVDRP